MTRPDIDFRVADLERRLANVVRTGLVAEVDLAAARVRAEYDRDAADAPVLTGWLPWLAARAGADRTWWPPTVGEQVLLVAPDGDLAQAVALPALYRTAHPAPESSGEKHTALYRDGALLEYDSGAHHLDAALPAGATLRVVANGGVSVIGDVTVTGNVAASGDVSDARSSMQAMRDVYNSHTNPPAGGTPQQMT